MRRGRLFRGKKRDEEAAETEFGSVVDVVSCFFFLWKRFLSLLGTWDQRVSARTVLEQVKQIQSCLLRAGEVLYLC